MSGRYTGYLICTDLDGTLMDHTGKPVPANNEAIRRFQQEGGRFTVSTGRMAEHLRQFRDDFVPNAPVITCNGACLSAVDGGQVLFYSELTCPAAELLPELLPFADRLQSVVLHALTARALPPFAQRLNSGAGVYRVAAADFLASCDVLTAQPWLKLVFVCADEHTAVALRQRLRASALGARFNFTRSWPVGLEMINADATKGHTLQRLRKLLPEVRRTVCFGDYENDITMLRMADIGFAVANAVDEAKRAADRITVCNDEGALAVEIDRLPPL